MFGAQKCGLCSGQRRPVAVKYGCLPLRATALSNSIDGLQHIDVATSAVVPGPTLQTRASHYQAPRKRKRQTRIPLPPRAFLERVCSLGLTGLALRRFLRSCGRPLRNSFRVNPVKATSDVLEKLRRSSGQISPIPWCKNGFFVDAAVGATALGHSRSRLSGEIYGQEPTSMLPVEVLHAILALEKAANCGNERGVSCILDLCAAPGSKTTQVAAGLGRGSLVVANEPDRRRACVLRMNLLQAGVSDFILTCKDGRSVGSAAPGVFDFVLVDAPCSAEGNMRKFPEVISRSDRVNEDFPAQAGTLVTLQRELLISGWEALRPGGYLIYSTCTLNIHENEGQCKWLLDTLRGSISIVDLDNLLQLPQLATEEGFLRAWPHIFDTEGFFVSCFHKKSRSDAPRDAEDVKVQAHLVASRSEAILNDSHSLPPDPVPRLDEASAALLQREAEKKVGYWPVDPGTLAEDGNGAVWVVPQVFSGVEQLAAHAKEPGVHVANRRKPAGGDGAAFELSDELILLAGDRGMSRDAGVPHLPDEEWIALLARVGGGVGELTSLMDVYAARGDAVKAEGVLSDMRERRLDPNVITYSTMIKAYSLANQVDKAEAVLSDIQRDNLSPSLDVYNALLDTHARASHMERASKAFSAITEARLSPDLVSYNTLLKACGSSGSSSMAEKTLRDLRESHLAPDLASYTILLNMHANAGSSYRAQRVFSDILHHRLTPDCISYTTLVKAYARAGDAAAASRVLDDMQQAGLRGDVTIYTTLMSAHARAGDFLSAERVLRDMEEQGLEPDLASHNALIRVYAKDGKVVEAERAFEEVRRRGMQPNVISYNALLKVRCRAGRMEEAEALVAELRTNHLEPDVVTFSTLMNAYSKLGAACDAERILSMMQTENIQPDRMIYDALIKSYRKAGDDKGAARASEEKRRFCNTEGRMRTEGSRHVQSRHLRGRSHPGVAGRIARAA